MVEANNTWALVLAAGEGSRLRSLTTAPSGTPVPKQFCSLFDGPPLLHEALRRAHSLTEEARTCAIVAEQHRQWWKDALAPLPPDNVIVQPRNRGTAIGILLPLLQILQRDPKANLVLLPSDHLVRKEAILADALRAGLDQLQWRHETLLMGIEPDEVDPELGYIVPGESDGRGAMYVARFVEKPLLAQTRQLIRAGSLWNAFIVVSSGQVLLELFRARIPDIVLAMENALADEHRQPGCAALAAVYDQLPDLDFSRDIVAGQEVSFRVLAVPQCGWSDLGTPKRVEEALREGPRPGVSVGTGARVRSGVAFLSLAAQHHRLHMAHGVAGA